MSDNLRKAIEELADAYEADYNQFSQSFAWNLREVLAANPEPEPEDERCCCGTCGL